MMKRAMNDDKELIVEILSEAFDENRSVNYVVDQTSKRKSRIRGLMDTLSKHAGNLEMFGYPTINKHAL
ncbi:MAG: hypothetical protein ABJA70_21365 [Chryseolinea sp.]